MTFIKRASFFAVGMVISGLVGYSVHPSGIGKLRDYNSISGQYSLSGEPGKIFLNVDFVIDQSGCFLKVSPGDGEKVAFVFWNIDADGVCNNEKLKSRIDSLIPQLLNIKSFP